MRWLVTGAGGMLGVDMVDVLNSSGHDVVGMSRAELDIRDAGACMRAVGGFDVVVNTAAWTDVDGAEADEAGAFSVNAVGAANVARACASRSALLVHVSTDYVFDGRATTPYRVDSPMSPINAYGRSKAAGEWAVRSLCPGVHVVRTSWLYGEHGANFVRTMLRLASERDAIDVVDDQRGQPTWTRDLAALVRDLVTEAALPGVRHGTAAGVATWYDLAREVFALSGFEPDRIRRTTTQHMVRPAPRPAYTVLDSGGRLPPWRDSLRAALPRMRAAS